MSHTSVPGPVNFKMFLRILKRMLKKAEGTKKESVSFNSISCLPFSKFNASLSDTVADTLSIPLQHIHANAGSQGSLGCFQELLELFWRIFFHLATADLLLLKVVVLWFALKADHFMNLWWKKGLQSVAEASWQLMVSTIFGVFSGNICIYICIYNII